MAQINVPPQAYTRETLAKAYNWLSGQPESIRTRAKDADTLVSLYLHSCRHGLGMFKENEIDDAPRSIQDFKSALKGLSKDIRQFEGKQQKVTEPFPSETNSQSTQQTETPQTFSSEVSLPNIDQEFEPSPAYRAYFNEKAPSLEASHLEASSLEASHLEAPSLEASHLEAPGLEASHLTKTSYPPSRTQTPPPKPLTLDPRSLDAIRRAQFQMNLSSESEALRMLISLGYDRVRTTLT